MIATILVGDSNNLAVEHKGSLSADMKGGDFKVPHAGGEDPALSLVLETALDAAVVMNAQGLVIGWSRRAEETFGWSKAEAISRPMAELIIPERYRQVHEEGLRRYLSSGHGAVIGRRIEISAVRKGGEEFPVELSIKDIDGGPDLRFVGFIRDISVRKRHEARLTRQADEVLLLHRVTSAAAGSATLEEVLQDCLSAICGLTGWPHGHAYVRSAENSEQLVPTNIWYSADDVLHEFRSATAGYVFARGEGLPGHAWAEGRAVWVTDVDDIGRFPRLAAARHEGIRSAFAFPLFVGGELAAVPEFFTKDIAAPDAETLHLVETLAAQVGRVLERRQAQESLRREVELRRRTEEHQGVLLHEMDHRVKNMLAVVMGVASQTARHSASLEEFSGAFNARLKALASGYDLLVGRGWSAASVTEIIDRVVCPHLGLPHQLTRRGSSLRVPPKAALAFAMIFHELATNALKYGALSVPDGRIDISWSQDSSGLIELVWKETGVNRPQFGAAGFGSRLIDATVKGEFKGEVERTAEPDGLRCRLTAVLETGD